MVRGGLATVLAGRCLAAEGQIEITFNNNVNININQQGSNFVCVGGGNRKNK